MANMKQIFEKSVVSMIDIPAGATITQEMIGIKKPGTGIAARRYNEVIGRVATRNIAKDSVLQEDDLHA
jgi:sialic acid synthase SpsE